MGLLDLTKVVNPYIQYVKIAIAAIIAILLILFGLWVWHLYESNKELKLAVAADAITIKNLKTQVTNYEGIMTANKEADKARVAAREKILPLRNRIESLVPSPVPCSSGSIVSIPLSTTKDQEKKDDLYEKAILLGNDIFECFHDDSLCAKDGGSAGAIGIGSGGSMTIGSGGSITIQ